MTGQRTERGLAATLPVEKVPSPRNAALPHGHAFITCRRGISIVFIRTLGSNVAQKQRRAAGDAPEREKDGTHTFSPSQPKRDGAARRERGRSADPGALIKTSFPSLGIYSTRALETSSPFSFTRSVYLKRLREKREICIARHTRNTRARPIIKLAGHLKVNRPPRERERTSPRNKIRI